MTRSPEENLKTFVDHLDALGVQTGMDLAVHSRLLTFGRIAGGAEAVYDILRDRVGPTATLVFPTYTLPLKPDDIYDPATTPSKGMGALSEYARNLPNAVRTYCPMHGHAATGPLCGDLMSCDPLRSLGAGSSFEWMHSAGFRLLLLGCTAQEGATFFHHVEAMAGVPYRTWMDIPRTVQRPDGTLERVACRYYGRQQGTSVRNDLRRAENAVRQHEACHSSPAGSRDSLLVPLSIVETTVRDLLEDDPYALTKTS